MISGAPNINRLWADLLVEELVRSGVDFFCLAPGSRSTPLVTAVAAHPKVRALMHYDERGTAFCALGYARAAGRPAAWITTSGTAVANGLPAAVEAATDGVPLLLITADRPPELRETGANQTVDQVGIFGRYARWTFDLPAPTPEIDPAVVLTTVDQAVRRTRRAPRGSVHLNCMFREPLAPDREGQDYGPYLSGLAGWREQDRPYTTYAAAGPVLGAADTEALADLLTTVERGLLVAGRLETRAEAAAVCRLAQTLGWPLLPDVGSHLRLGRMAAGDPHIPYYDPVLLDKGFARRHAPEAVLHLGGRSLSKRLLQFLERYPPRNYITVRPNPGRLDPSHQVTWSIEAELAPFCEALGGALAGRRGGAATPSGWRQAWQQASDRVARSFDLFFEGAEELSEPGVARLVAALLPEEHGLCLASSMPIRDMDGFAAPGGAAPPVAANRGASGIDGTVATAAGFAEGLGAPVTLVVGDLALLHDLNSLALLRERPVVVVAVNNHGGGIFSFLPIARHEDVFEPFFGTPHPYSFRSAADLFGLAYAHPSTPDGFAAAYREACGRGGGTLIEVTTDRVENHALHERLQKLAAEAVAEDGGQLDGR